MRFALLAALVASPAAAQVRAVPDQPASAEAARAGVDVYLFNEGVDAAPVAPPAELRVTAADAARVTLAPDGPVPAMVAAGGFVKLRYRAVIAPAPDVQVASAGGTSSTFRDRFEPLEPIYGVAGLGDAGAKLQVSFAFRPFDGDGLLRHFRFGYTQTMFWALNRPSGPFRATNYSPQAYIDLPVDARTNVAFGYAHDSNGEGEPGSIDVNRLFVRAARRFPLGGGWTAEVSPQAWVYVGKQGAAPDLDRYWGYTSLRGSLIQDDGLKLSLTARGNPGTGRGAAELYASYPLARPLGVGVYLFGQGFTGYGEALDDFRVNDTQVRLGIALTR